MDRYVFLDHGRLPPGLPVISVPTQNGFVWIELTATEYETAVADPELASHVEDGMPRDREKRGGL